MPAHRKPTHRHRTLAVALLVALTGSGVAFAQADDEWVTSSPEQPPTVTQAPSPSLTPPDPTPGDTGERRPRPSRTSGEQRADLQEPKTDKTPTTPRPKPRRTRTPEPARATEPTPETAPTPRPRAAAPANRSRILRDSNAARADAGLRSLAVDSCLTKMAKQHAERLADEDRLYHQDLGAVMSTCGLSTAGENVAMNYSGPADMVDQWLESPGHRANLLSSRFSLIGVAVAEGRDGAWYGVQVFGA